ncbi:MAG: ABC transporter permease [Chloroflexi bacterium]|nr:ABC transporter permease [Chloroflexota bacterium]
MIDFVFFQYLLSAAIRMATPIALGAIGATYNERAGVLNIGIEGMMLTGAFTGAISANYSGNPWIGLLGGVAGGLLAATIFGLLTIYFNGDQVVVSVGLNLLALGATTFLLSLIWGNRGTSDWLPGLPTIRVPVLADIPVLGPILGSGDPIVYMTWIIVAASYFIIFRTPFGLRLRAAGEHPTAVETLGLNVFRLRFIAVLISGALAGLGGVQLSLGQLNVFTQNMTASRGFLAFAANQFGQWNPVGAYFASLLFGVTEALQMRLQAFYLAPQLLQMIPYITTIIVLATAVRRTVGPAALGVLHKHTFDKGT